MAFELMSEGFAENWVDELSPAHLRHYYDELIRTRAERQRELLHIQVSAAAVVADGGKLAKQQDSALSVASRRGTVAEPPSPDAPDDAAVRARVQRAAQQTAHVTREFGQRG